MRGGRGPEIFSGLYKRFDRDGIYDLESPHAAMAGRLRVLLQQHATTSVLLLTARPIQNSTWSMGGSCGSGTFRSSGIL